MCGIAGILLRQDDVEFSRLRRAAELLQHRGPDDLGYLGWDGSGDPRLARDSRACAPARVAFAHRRLSILDLSHAGWQPMASADGRHYMVFNGEIYNFRELREELEGLGHRFRSQGDSEVLIEAWSRWGEEALRRLVGMFAFAVLDTRERRLFLVRDFFGIKPLYYQVWSDGFAFGSEIKALLELTGLRPRVDPEPLYDYLRFGLTDHTERTMFASVRQLPPAHLLELSLDAPQHIVTRRYWDVDLERRSDLTFEDAAERLRELFLDSVRLHLRSDVAVGTALSGGIDSSAIVMAMRHLQGDDLALHSIGYVADDPAISEERWIDLVAGEARATLHRTSPDPAELLQDLEELIRVQDEPFGSTSIYAQHRVFRLARESGVKVMLDGQGADEMLGGYRTYLAARVTSLLRQGRIGSAMRLLTAAGRLPGGGVRDVVRGVGYLVLPDSWQGIARRATRRELGPQWLDLDWFADRDVPLRSPLPHAKGREALREMLYLTLTVSSLPMLLRYEDRNSMAHSIESRVPFLTPAIVEFVLSLPESYLIDANGTSKAVFRRAMRGIVPDVVLDRRDKIGFATPELRWLGQMKPWVDGLLSGESARRVAPLRTDAARREWEAILLGKHRFDWHVWRWINTIRWAERFEISFAD